MGAGRGLGCRVLWFTLVQGLAVASHLYQAGLLSVG